MNTEINLLEKQTHKYFAPLFYGSIFLFAVLCVMGLIIFQKSTLEKQLLMIHNQITDMELIVTEHNQAVAPKRKLMDLKSEVENLKAEMVPHVTLYKHILALLPANDRLDNYYFEENSTFTIEAEFTSLDDVATYVTRLLEQEFILNTELTRVNFQDSMYEATLTVDLDADLLVKELGKHE